MVRPLKSVTHGQYDVTFPAADRRSLLYRIILNGDGHKLAQNRYATAPNAPRLGTEPAISRFQVQSLISCAITPPMFYCGQLTSKFPESLEGRSETSAVNSKPEKPPD